MRKLAWFVIIVLIVALSLAVLCLYSPPFSATMYDLSVNVVGLGLVNLIAGAMTGMMAWGSESLAQAAAVTFGTLLFAIILWTLVAKKYIWPKIKGVAQPITSNVTLRGGPEPELPQSIEKTAPTEVKKEESSP